MMTILKIHFMITLAVKNSLDDPVSQFLEIFPRSATDRRGIMQRCFYQALGNMATAKVGRVFESRIFVNWKNKLRRTMLSSFHSRQQNVIFSSHLSLDLVRLYRPSTYAAAPGPKEFDQKDDDNSKVMKTMRLKFSRFIHVSSTFDILDSLVGKNVALELGPEKGGRSSGKNEEIWPFKGLEESEEYPGIQLFDEKGKKGQEFEESTTLQDFSDKEQSIYSTAALTSFHNETALSGSTTYGENLGIPEGLDFPAVVPFSPKAAKDSDLPSNAWWKRRAASLYAHAKEANTFWSIFVAAAVMGIVILGSAGSKKGGRLCNLSGRLASTMRAGMGRSVQAEKQERDAMQIVNSYQQLQNNFGRLSYDMQEHERSGSVLRPITRLKDVIVGGNRRGSFIRGSSTSDN
ncbi:ATG8-interacting protein 2 [Populus alba x Populus x berolinensis]|uniref:ATG8-interacting protein 2 n=1 Tax=Populus alba x Populus x berolinensis TaxID=444605 RepID=A0AAD6LSK9_9ROSI|nr:ATG8-interacting protein 2 [Populus alba x Populus x berolinensis]